jgi:hypothetical protein
MVRWIDIEAERRWKCFDHFRMQPEIVFDIIEIGMDGLLLARVSNHANLPQ